MAHVRGSLSFTTSVTSVQITKFWLFQRPRYTDFDFCKQANHINFKKKTIKSKVKISDESWSGVLINPFYLVQNILSQDLITYFCDYV